MVLVTSVSRMECECFRMVVVAVAVAAVAAAALVVEFEQWNDYDRFLPYLF